MLKSYVDRCLFALALAHLILNGYGQATSLLTVTCTNGIELWFDLEFVEFTSVNRYRLERIPQNNDQNCAGTITIAGRDNVASTIDREYDLIELGSDVFQKLPNVDTLYLGNNFFATSHKDMYLDSDGIQTMNMAYNHFTKLDSSTQFAPGLTNLIFDRQVLFQEIKLDFFTSHPNLIKIDISAPNSPQIKFEEGIFQNLDSLETLKMTDMPIKHLEKALLSNNAPSLKFVEMGNWRQLLSVEYNAFFGVSLEQLDLAQWPFETIDPDLFSGAAIKKILLRRSKVHTLKPGSFSNLQNSQKIDFSVSKLTSIEAGAFRNFNPLNNFELSIPEDISCCKLDGLRELIDVSNSILINDNSQNYTCLTPDNDLRVVDILTNEDSSADLVCCDFEKQYYNYTAKVCGECTVHSPCQTSFDTCDGERSNFFTCNKCKTGYSTTNSIDCQACRTPVNCTKTSTECSPSADFGNYLICEECGIEGFSPHPETGMCEACVENSLSCTTYGTSCVLGTQNLVCEICNDTARLLENGTCEVFVDNTVPLVVSLGVSIAIVVVIGGLAVTFLFVCLRRRKKRKKNELLKSCGIFKQESNIELHPVEFSEIPEVHSRTELPGSGHLQIGDGDSINYLSIIRQDDVLMKTDHHKGLDTEGYLSNVRIGSTITDSGQHNIQSSAIIADEYVQLGVQQSNSDNCREYEEGVQLGITDETNEYVQLGAQTSRTHHNLQAKVNLQVRAPPRPSWNVIEKNNVNKTSKEKNSDYDDCRITNLMNASRGDEDYVELGVRKESNLKVINHCENDEYNANQLNLQPIDTHEMFQKDVYTSVCLKNANDHMNSLDSILHQQDALYENTSLTPYPHQSSIDHEYEAPYE